MLAWPVALADIDIRSALNAAVNWLRHHNVRLRCCMSYMKNFLQELTINLPSIVVSYDVSLLSFIKASYSLVAKIFSIITIDTT